MTDIMEARRKGFEEWVKIAYEVDYKEEGDALFERGTDGFEFYSWYWVNQEFKCWNAALDSVCVELPGYPATCDMTSTLICETIDQCAKAIERAGLKVKP